jgi:hypothetical protein
LMRKPSFESLFSVFHRETTLGTKKKPDTT